MDESLDKIISLIKNHTQNYYYGLPMHSSDRNLSSRISHGYQLIFGVSNTDPLAIDVKFYQSKITRDLEREFMKPMFLAFPYCEKNNLLEVLRGLSTEYNANLNIDRLIRDIKFSNDQPVYLVVSLIKFPVILPE